MPRTRKQRREAIRVPRGATALAARDRVVPSGVVSEFHALLPTVDQLHDEGWGTVHLASTIIPARDHGLRTVPKGGTR